MLVFPQLGEDPSAVILWLSAIAVLLLGRPVAMPEDLERPRADLLRSVRRGFVHATGHDRDPAAARADAPAATGASVYWI